jgi:hypothetical protein
VLETGLGTLVEVHSLGRAAVLHERLKQLHGVGTMTVVDDNLLTVRVPHSKILLLDAAEGFRCVVLFVDCLQKPILLLLVKATLLSDQFGQDGADKKAEQRAESRSYQVLMTVLSEVCNQLDMEPLTVSWKQSLTFVRSSLQMLIRRMQKTSLLTAQDAPPCLKEDNETECDFGRLRWSSMAVQGFVLRSKHELFPSSSSSCSSRVRWIRVTSVDKYTDIHGEMKQSEAEKVAEKLGSGVKVGKKKKSFSFSSFFLFERLLQLVMTRRSCCAGRCVMQWTKRWSILLACFVKFVHFKLCYV